VPRSIVRQPTDRSSGVLFFPISLSSCACSGGERNSPSLISPGWREPSTEFPWACGPSEDMKITSSPPRKRATSPGRGWIPAPRLRGDKLRGNDAHGAIFRSKQARSAERSPRRVRVFFVGWRRRCFLTSAICRRHVSPRVVRRCPGHLPGPFGKSQTPDYGVCASQPAPSERFHSDGDYRARGPVGNSGGSGASGFPACPVELAQRQGQPFRKHGAAH